MRARSRRSKACGAAGSGSCAGSASREEAVGRAGADGGWARIGGRAQRGPPMKGSLRWRVLLVLALAAIVPTIVVGALAILRARHDVQDEVQRGALAHIRALGAALDDTLQDSRRTVELAAQSWADAPDDARETQLLLRRLRRDVPIVKSLSIVDPDGKLLYGDAVPAGIDIGSHSFGGYIGDAVFEGGRPPRVTIRAGARRARAR